MLLVINLWSFAVSFTSENKLLLQHYAFEDSEINVKMH